MWNLRFDESTKHWHAERKAHGCRIWNNWQVADDGKRAVDCTVKLGAQSMLLAMWTASDAQADECAERLARVAVAAQAAWEADPHPGCDRGAEHCECGAGAVRCDADEAMGRR